MIARARLGAVALVAAAAAPLDAQALGDRIAAVGDGWAGIEFAARPGVCGEGHDIRVFREAAPHAFWESGCAAGPVRVLFQVRARRIVEIDTYVGGRWRDDPRLTDLGRVGAPAATALLLGLVESAHADVAKQAIYPARLADSIDVWPRLLGIAKDRSRGAEVRKSVIFWLAQEAGARAAESLESFVNDSDEHREVKESAVFAISRLPEGQAVPRLMDIARAHPDPHMRKQALFWLGRSDDPRALGLIEEILTGAPRRP